MHKAIDLTSQQFGQWTVLKLDGHNKNQARLWLCECTCGTQLKITTSKLNDGSTTKCWTCANGKKCGTLATSFFKHIKRHAEKRNLDFDITIEEIWNLFLKQNKKCALSNVELLMIRDYKRKPNQHTASLDRIDSLKGYTLDNIQWVHKDINMLKNSYPQEKFINWCHLVSKNMSKK